MLIGKREEFDLNEMAIFVRVVESKSFTGAAKILGLPKSTVSRKITQLEERLGVRLIQRTTRSLHLTDTGTEYYQQCARILGDIEEANVAVTQMQSVPSGTLRVTAPVLFGSTVLSNLISDFMIEHPQVKIDLILSDQLLDIVQDGIDVAFRIGQLEDSSLIGRYLGEVRGILCASPKYIEKFGAPTHPDELHDHQILGHTTHTQWTMHDKDGNEKIINTKPRLTVNDLTSLYNLSMSGAGIAALPVLMSADAIKSKQLIPVLCPWPFDAFPVHILYASNRHLSAKVRSFIDYIIEQVRPIPPWQVDLGPNNGCDEHSHEANH